MDLTPTNQNQEVQALTEWKPSKIGNSTANIILNAQALEPIRFRSEEELKQVLRYAMVLVGLRGNNMPTEEEKFVLLNFIKSNFGNQTPEEIKLAFEYAIAGKFDVDVKCYENFSCEYFARIMKAYIAFEREEMRSVKKVFHFEVDKPTEEALKRQAIEIANNYADQIEKSKEEGKEYQWYTAGLASLYDYLDCEGTVQTITLLSGERSERICMAHWLSSYPTDYVEYFGNCALDGDVYTCPPPVYPRRSLKPGYNTPYCSTWKYEEISCKSAEALYKQVLELRYGITNCCPEEDQQYIIQKQLIDLKALIPTL